MGLKEYILSCDRCNKELVITHDYKNTGVEFYVVDDEDICEPCYLELDYGFDLVKERREGENWFGSKKEGE